MVDPTSAGAGLYVVSFGVAVLSALVPVVNAELYVGGVALAGGNAPAAVALGLLVALGQMVGKGFLYRASEGVADLSAQGGAENRRITRARTLVSKWQHKPLTLCFVSASVGLPPFYLVTIAAGLLKVRFGSFLLMGFLGRAVRFITVAVIAAGG